MTDHLATGMKRMIRTVARSASLSDRLRGHTPRARASVSEVEASNPGCCG